MTALKNSLYCKCTKGINKFSFSVIVRPIVNGHETNTPGGHERVKPGGHGRRGRGRQLYPATDLNSHEPQKFMQNFVRLCSLFFFRFCRVTN